MKSVCTTIVSVFECSLESAFKSPMLCDVTKVHTGYLFMPKAIASELQETWGKVGGTRKIVMAGNIFKMDGGAIMDRVLERIENRYWKIEIFDLTVFAAGIQRFEGEWTVEQIEANRVKVEYKYTLFFKHDWLMPFYYLFVKTGWRLYMKHVLENVRELANNNSPYLYN